ncbi:MAG: ATP-binding protein [Chloroflexi bacterium]|jgi:DNA replication protein DnaC|nr:ATP-binding protein [Chloroflexota bacterium]
MKTSSSDNQENQNPGLGQQDCPYCEGLGYVVLDVPPVHPLFGRAQPCFCRAQEREVERLNKLLELSQLGALKNCTFESFLPKGHGLTDVKQLNLSMAYESASDYAKSPNGWLIFKGGYGCGKTHLAAAIANYRINLGHPVLFINTPDLLDHLRAAYSPSAETGYDARFDQVRNAPLLILDDLGTQSNTDWAQEKLYQIFNYRYNARLPTVVTTNEELEDIDIRVRSRMADSDLAQIVHIAAPDFRLAGGDQGQSDLSSLNLHLDQTFATFDFREGELPRAEARNLQNAYETAFEFALEPANWLMLYSIGFGNGKTHLAASIANYVANKGRPVLFIVVPDLLDHLRATFNPASNARLDKRFNEIKTSPLLILDDLGTESATGWVKEKLYQLFNYRYNARLPTVITTTHPLDQLDPKLASRVGDPNRCTIFSLEVPSYRGGTRKKNGRR